MSLYDIIARPCARAPDPLLDYLGISVVFEMPCFSFCVKL